MKATVIAEKPGKYSWNDGGVVYSAEFDNYHDAKQHMDNINAVDHTPNGFFLTGEKGVFLDIIVDTTDED